MLRFVWLLFEKWDCVSLNSFQRGRLPHLVNFYQVHVQYPPFGVQTYDYHLADVSLVYQDFT